MNSNQMNKTQTIKNSFFLLFTIYFAILNTGLPANSPSLEALPRPTFLSEVVKQFYYNGESADLMLGGLSIDELTHRKLPERKQENDQQWLRKVSYFNNITALIDTTIAGGYGRLYGPSAQDSIIPGHEYIAYSKDTTNQIAASLMLHIPDSFDFKHPCLIVSPSSGSRGLYGAVGTTGSWALLNRCAIVYTDKGTAPGFYFPDKNAGYDLLGQYLEHTHVRESTNGPLTFAPKLSLADRNFLKAHPDAVLTKHAYSKNNLESDWGKYVLQAAEFGLFQLNRHIITNELKQAVLTKQSTIIIAASISNGGAASIRAAEQDSDNWIDAVVVAEPNIYVSNDSPLTISSQGKTNEINSQYGFSYFTLINLYSPCAVLSKQSAQQPFANHSEQAVKIANSWCENLVKDGYLEKSLTASYPEQAQTILEKNGILPNQATLRPLSQVIQLWPALAATYANQFLLSGVGDSVCGVYFSHKNLPAAERKLLAANSNGIPPTAKISLAQAKSKTPYQVAKCFYQLNQNKKLLASMQKAKADLNLRSKPTIIIHGRDDNLIAPNHSSRAYYARHQTQSPQENLKYYEVTNAQHFDAFISLPHYADKFIPLHHYYEKSLEMMLKHLRHKTKLPPSQVIYTQTRQTENGKLLPLELTNLPDITNKSRHLITIENEHLKID